MSQNIHDQTRHVTQYNRINKLRLRGKLNNRLKKMSGVVLTSWSLLLVVALVACASESRAAHAASDEQDARFERVQPFSMGQLPSRREEQERPDWCSLDNAAACLGRVLRLNTKKQPKLREAKPTRFHIYADGRWTDGIEFQVRLPFASGKSRDLDPERDFQFNLKTLASIGFDPHKQTVILIPGYLNTRLVPWQSEAAGYLTEMHRGEVNIIVVIWPEVYTVYEQSVSETVMIARQVTVFLHYLAQLSGTSLQDQEFLNKIHLVGHSLGAHISGFVGKDLGGRAGRITGLDPAGPAFEKHARDQRLDRADAQLVEVLHTNAGKMQPLKAGAIALVNSFALLFSGRRALKGGTRFGMQPQLGHIDYFANDGQRQQGCTDPVHFCDHSRGYQIYVNLLKHQLFLRDNLTLAAAAAATGDTSQRRLWAMRVNNYETFASGAHLANMCPELIEPASHLNPAEVSKTFNKCAVPLMDFTKPTNELIRELSDDFKIDFDPNADSARQPSFHFSTQENPRDLLDIVGRQFMLKIYLDRNQTKWHQDYRRTKRCKLEARLQMDSGERVLLKVRVVDPNQSILTMPFAHPSGIDADSELRALLSELDAARAASKSGALIGRPSQVIKRLLRGLFPRSVELQLVDRGSRRDVKNACKLAVRELEVQPISLPDGLRNVGVISGAELFGSKRSEYEFVGTRKLAECLNAVAPRVALLSRSEAVTKLLRETRLTLVDDTR